jgi:2-octaprenyl-6-methoxyphenol hydroxylase
MNQKNGHQELEYDVLIVGAGMVGSSLAAALGQTSLRVGIIEAKTRQERVNGDDGRASALALGSVQILDRIGAWKVMRSLGVSPIEQVQISDEQFPLVATLRREEIQVEALGYVVENWVTSNALEQVLAQQTDVHTFCPAKIKSMATHRDRVEVLLDWDGKEQPLTAQLLVGADGRQSWVRQWANLPMNSVEYDQVLIVSNVITEFSHSQTGYERFHRSGPFAVLPMTPSPEAPDLSRSCVVWTAKKEERDRLMSLDDRAFMEAMQPRLPKEMGQLRSITPRSCYVPRRQHVRQYAAQRLTLIGDAAHATHPVGGQGFNMGMRDVAALSSLLIEAHIQGKDLGDRDLLQRYQQQRQPDNETVLTATDLANRVFSNDWLPLQWMRDLGLVGIDRFLPVKKVLIEYAMGLADGLPR